MTSEPDPSTDSTIHAGPSFRAREAGGAGWQSTTDAVELGRWIRSLPSVVVLTHSRPDGDALGSAIGLVRAINLAHGGPDAGVSGVLSVAEAWFAGTFPTWAGRVAGGTKFRVLGEGEQPGGALDPAGVVVVDTGAWTQLAPFEAWLRARADRAAVIDHHLSGNADVAPRRLIRTDAAAAAEIVAEVACSVLGVSDVSGLPREVAEPLYLGISTDTGWFRHSNVTPGVLRTAAGLLDCGVRPGPLFELVEQQDRPSRLRLLRRALERLEWFDDESIAVMSLSTEDFRELGASPGETGGFHEMIKSVSQVRVTVLLTEVSSAWEGPMTKVSMRSKASEEQFVDVNRAAQALGGGGHAQAAGARVPAPLDLARTFVLEAIRDEMHRDEAEKGTR